MVLRLNTIHGFATIITAYAPTLTSSEETKDQFYNQLDETVSKVSTGDRLYILGDFNARVGQDFSTWPSCIGYHGVGNMNENGQRLLEFCSDHRLCVTNTFFKGKLSHRVSWKHPRSGHWHQLDVVLSRSRDLREILHTRTFHSADCDTDHSLVVARVAIAHKKIHTSHAPGKRKINLANVNIDENRLKFESLITADLNNWDTDVSITVEWNNIKNILTSGAGEAFGYMTTKSQDWFANNIQHLQPLLDAKREAALNHRLHSSPVTDKNLRTAKSALQRSVRYFANLYWTNLGLRIQTCADNGNIGGVYEGIKQVLGPVPKKTAPLKDADGFSITDPRKQLDRWVEHYTGLYSRPTNLHPDAVNNMPKLDLWTELDDLPSIEEFNNAVNKLKSGKSPGCDGTHAEIIKLQCVRPMLFSLLRKCWEAGEVPQDMRDANIVTIYKGKGDRGDCNCYRGISLLSIVGKLFSRVIQSRLQKLANRVYPESQCGFRPQRSTTDMIFTLRQLQEKCREQKTPLFVAFVDLNKAFDTVSREGLYSALESIGCPPKLLCLIKSFHENMNGIVVFNGSTSEPFKVCRGVRQGCVLAPTLFGIYFSLMLRAAFSDDHQGVHLHTRTDGRLFNISLLKSKKHREDLFVDNLLFADDAALLANSPFELQSMIDRFSRACSQFAMTVNTSKTVILSQGTPAGSTVSLNGTPIVEIDRFCYLGSTVSNNLSLDSEIDIRIGKAATMFGKLNEKVWRNKHLTVKTKMIVFQASILSILLYGAETWTSYAKQERRLNSFYMRCLRKILGITWQNKITNQKVLQTAQLPSLTTLLKQKRLRWLGHVYRMEPSRLPRRVMLGAIADARRDIGRPLLRFKDCVKRDMASFKIDHNNWEKLATNRSEWRKLVSEGCRSCDESWFRVLADRRRKRHQDDSESASANFPCPTCGKVCRSRIGLFGHQKHCSGNTP
ncbi:uncharacterized protein LOC123700381 [Colias croceus]|uniref:uncharacterized protein LOC123700381 n=1 Tax=Colias crocea TaxID=72248 RepID=UPI001E27FE91|nr:uncharacterized protein LOC123700381 [Colias croceus]